MPTLPTKLLFEVYTVYRLSATLSYREQTPGECMSAPLIGAEENALNPAEATWANAVDPDNITVISHGSSHTLLRLNRLVLVLDVSTVSARARQECDRREQRL